MAFRSALYQGWVMHRRLRPRVHQFRYRVFAMLIELDELPALDRALPLFGWNRFSLFSFHDCDHGPADASRGSLNGWLDGLLADAGIAAPGPRQVLCYPRILGYVFNPLSVWFCRDTAGALKATIYEVHNTYGERHAYVLPVRDSDDDSGAVRQGCAKDFYVSPFLSHDCAYQFRVHPPTDKIAVAIQQEEQGRPVLHASFTGRRRALDGRALAAMLFAYPLMTVKVVAAIHVEAVRLMLKGIKRHPHARKATYQKAPAYTPPRVRSTLEGEMP